MKQAILYGAGDLRIEERPLDVDSLKDQQVYVETEVTALSTGTDLGNYLGKSTEVPGAPDYPRPVGYSNVGVIRRVGLLQTSFPKLAFDGCAVRLCRPAAEICYIEGCHGSILT